MYIKKLELIAALLLFLGGCSGGKQAAPTSVAVPPYSHDALLVVNGESNSISIIEVAENKVIGTIALKNVSYPHHMNLSPDGTKLALAIPGSDLSAGHGGGDGPGHGGMSADKGAVMVLDARTGATLAARRFKEMNHNAIFSPDGQEIWTGQMSSPGTVLVLDARTLKTITAISVGDEPAEVTFSSDASYAFVANGRSNSVSVIDRQSKKVVKTVPVGQEPVGAWTGKNGLMYVDNEAGKSLTVIDPRSLAATGTYDLGFTPAMAAIGPDGLLWVTDTENGRVVFYRPDSDTKVGELAVSAGAHAVAFAADGTTAYVTNQGSGTVSVIDVAVKAVKATIKVGMKPNGMVWRGR